MLLAQLGGYSIGQILIAVIIIAACFAITYVVLRQFGMQIPQWAIAIFWIVVIAFIGVFAIKLLLGMP